jgi:translation initiation factor eIF-2B subunit alpha
VRCHLIGDNEIGYFVPEVTCVLTGAQVILDNGGILSRAGTSVLALLAHSSRKPLYVFAESYKFLRRNYLCQRDIPQHFSEDRRGKGRSIAIDLTPPEHISLFCTDNGLYNPETIALDLAKILK